MDLEIILGVNEAIKLYCDNSGVMTNSKEPMSHKRGKHIKRKYHLIREIVYQGYINVMKISSENNLVDPFTKTLAEMTFNRHLE